MEMVTVNLFYAVITGFLLAVFLFIFGAIESYFSIHERDYKRSVPVMLFYALIASGVIIILLLGLKLYIDAYYPDAAQNDDFSLPTQDIILFFLTSFGIGFFLNRKTILRRMRSS